MTKPTVTYGHKLTMDFTALTEVHLGTSQTWTEGNRTNCVDADVEGSILHGDILKITLDCDQADTVEGAAYTNSANLGISSTLYPAFLLRYRTSENSAGAHAKVILEYSDASTQTIVDDAYSTVWQIATGTLTSGKTLDHIRMYVECDLDTPNANDYYVEYDFVVIHKGTFEFPFVAPGGVWVGFPQKTVELDIWGRDGGIIQRGGMKCPRIHMVGNADTNTGWGSPTGEHLYRILRGSLGDYREPWNWLTSPVINCKVTPAPEGGRIGMVDEAGVVRKWSMDFLYHATSGINEADWDELEWAGQ